MILHEVPAYQGKDTDLYQSIISECNMRNYLNNLNK